MSDRDLVSMCERLDRLEQRCDAQTEAIGLLCEALRRAPCPPEDHGCERKGGACWLHGYARQAKAAVDE